MRDLILGARSRRSEAVEVPEWGGTTVSVVTMSGAERDSLDAESFALTKAGKSPIENYRTRVLVRALRDTGGARIFEDADAEKLGEQSDEVIRRLYAIASRLNGLFTAEGSGPGK